VARPQPAAAQLRPAGALVTFLVGAPIAALAAGWWAQAAASQVARAQHASWRQVSAVLVAGAPGAMDVGYGAAAPPEARARWTAPDGTARRGYVLVPVGTQAGRTVRIWVDRAGWQTGPPLRPDQVAGQTVLAMVVALFTLGAVLVCAGALGLQAVDRRRLAAWDAEWQTTGPQWTSLR
jgi:hypothetical protein